MKKELHSGHILFGYKFETLARRQDNDDVLFRVAEGDTVKYAVVHMIWSSNASSSEYPLTKVFNSLPEAIQNVLVPDSLDW